MEAGQTTSSVREEGHPQQFDLELNDGIETMHDHQVGDTTTVKSFVVESPSYTHLTQPTVAPLTETSHHRLHSLEPGESDVEQLAARIDSMYINRLPVTAKVKHWFLQSCLDVAHRSGLKGKIKLEDLIKLHDTAKQEASQRHRVVQMCIRVGIWLGLPDDRDDYVQVLERGILYCEELHTQELHFQDFAFYKVRVKARWPWRRNETVNAILFVLLFYLATPLLFCVILNDKSVCPRDPTGEKPRYYGFLTSIYFASNTMSSVGYGDVTIDKSSRVRIGIGIIYMMVAALVAILAFSAAAAASLSPISRSFSKLIDKLTCDIRHRKGGLLHVQIRRYRYIVIAEVVIQFMLLNLFGVFAVRSFLTRSQLQSQSWLLSFYWAVQTTTTIGYGDVRLPWDFRWFQIFYLILSTYFVGGALARLGNLKQELEEFRHYYAWERREASKALIHDMKICKHDDKLDQYEFVVASLLTLRKISPKDVERIMEKFRSLAGPNGYIQLSHVEEIVETKSEVESIYNPRVWEECDFGK